MTRDIIALASVRRLKCMKGALHIEKEFTCNLGVQHGVWERAGCGMYFTAMWNMLLLL
jgi:hypothetical protein